jgi:hypothetical protein
MDESKSLSNVWPRRDPPNPELASLPDLFLIDPKNRSFVAGQSHRLSAGPPSRGGYLGILTVLLVVIGIILVTAVTGILNETLLGPICLLLLLVTGLYLMERQRAFKLQRRGQLLRGTVQRAGHTKEVDEENETVYYVRIIFTVPTVRGETELELRRRVKPNYIDHYSKIHKGTTLAVLYVDDRTWRVL